MKKLLIAIVCFALFSCGKSKSPKEIAQEICDCSKKANGMDPKDPKRSDAQQECQKKNVAAWNKIKDDIEDAKEFNAVMSKCADEQIKKSFGQ